MHDSPLQILFSCPRRLMFGAGGKKLAKSNSAQSTKSTKTLQSGVSYREITTGQVAEMGNDSTVRPLFQGRSFCLTRGQVKGQSSVGYRQNAGTGNNPP